MKQAINGISQEFNDNMNNPDTELCYHCKVWKLKTEFTNKNGAHVCDSCNSVCEEEANKRSVVFEEVPGRVATTIWGNTYFITDVYATKDGIKNHLGGYVPKGGFDEAHDKVGIFARKMQFLNSNGGFIKFYCHAGCENPLDFIKHIKEIKDNFGKAYDCSIKKYKEFWEFGGNLERISCAFSFRIFDESVVNEIRKVISDPYYKNISFTFFKE